tara:strand:- start:4398 stop:5498 length:1101 start_codon:yes stop_codon:yes gene_type:complete
MTSKAFELARLGNAYSDGALSNRNLIINGNFSVWQRASATTTVSANNYFTADRWKFFKDSGANYYTSERSTDVPSGQGFGYSMKLQCVVADTSIGSSQYAQIVQRIEGQDCQRLAYGSSGAKDLTVSFWVKSNKTGTYTICLRKDDGTPYNLPVEYSISSANTWEKKEILLSPTAGNTSLITNSGGAIANDTGVGLDLYFNLMLGSSYSGGTNNTWTSNSGNDYATSNQLNWLDSTSNNFYITGIQLEVGDTATPFEHRSFGDELARCQRYYCILDFQTAHLALLIRAGEDSSGKPYNYFTLPVEMRAASSLTTSGTFLDGAQYTDTPSLYKATTGAVTLVGNNGNISAGSSQFLRGGQVLLDAEL